ncbi:hypothetical protein AB0E63_30770 [Kribbella sp. NPDC026596]|uniref:hypothetical protein n=1 Tax=Kribbella sp. NPDC026596 TaxID=3155122 RepID=UPI0033EDF371
MTQPGGRRWTADVFQALIRDRPHRPAFSTTAAAGVVPAQARAGLLDPDALLQQLGAAR